MLGAPHIFRGIVARIKQLDFLLMRGDGKKRVVKIVVIAPQDNAVGIEASFWPRQPHDTALARWNIHGSFSIRSFLNAVLAPAHEELVFR